MGQYCFSGWVLSSVVVCKTLYTPATMSKQHCRMLQSSMLLRQSRTLLRHCCWCGPGLTLPAGGRADRRARGRSGGRHCTAGQYGYVPLGWHLVYISYYVVYTSSWPTLHVALQPRLDRACSSEYFHTSTCAM